MMTNTILSFIIWMVSTGVLQVETNLSSVTVDGTSTLHDWTMQVEKIQTEGSLTQEDAVYATDGLTLVFPVKGLESGKDAMNSNTYEAMDEKNHPNVIFQLQSLARQSGSNYKAHGKLTINGNTKQVTVPVSFSGISGDRILSKGSYTFKMSGYGVEPPEVMWGTVTTGDKITVNFNIVLTQS